MGAVLQKATVAQMTTGNKFKAGADLRRRLLEAASRLFRESGYENVSIRNIAQAVGCSQMAMYRHFPDKDALIRQLCTELYKQFTVGVRTKFGHLTDPKEQLRLSLHYFILLAIRNPNHYRFTFLLRTTDEKALQMRNEVAEPTLAFIRKNLKLALPAGSTDALIEERLHELLATLHGLAVMLITYPKAYRMTREKALKRLDTSLDTFTRVSEAQAGNG